MAKKEDFLSLNPKAGKIFDCIQAHFSQALLSMPEGTENSELVTFAMQIVKKRALSSRNALEKTIDHRLSALRKREEEEEPPNNADIRDLQADLPLDEATAERTAVSIVKSAIPKEKTT